MIYIGIDPGKGGGLALVDDQGVLEVEKMPETARDLLDLLHGWKRKHHHWGLHAMIERVHSMPKQGVVSAFTFGEGYGALLMALTAERIPFEQVTPQRWQKAMGCRTKGDKNVSKRRAQQLFPHLTITHAIADSLLIAEYCRRLYCGMLVNGLRHAPKKIVADAGSGKATATDTGSSDSGPRR